MKRKQKLFPVLFAAAAALFLAVALFLAYKPTDPIPPVLRTLSPSSPGGAYRLNLNDATAAELESLPGIGPVLAANILAWREENRFFISMEDLLEVDGIGKKTCENLEPYITFE